MYRGTTIFRLSQLFIELPLTLFRVVLEKETLKLLKTSTFPSLFPTDRHTDITHRTRIINPRHIRRPTETFHVSYLSVPISLVRVQTLIVSRLHSKPNPFLHESTTMPPNIVRSHRIVLVVAGWAMIS